MFKIINFLLLFTFVQGNIEEKNLLDNLFESYDKTTRPVKNYKDTLIVEMGLGVQTLESFNQMEESLALNIWLRSNWVDENLAWYNSSNVSFLSINPDDIWTPDIELLNAASKPEIYTLKGGLNLYNDGGIMYSKPGIFKYSCSLDLKKFPFDDQKCTMKFGNWIYNNSFVYLKPYDDEDKQVDILSSFSHSEWEIQDVTVIQKNETRECCPGEEFNTLYYSFILKRYPHYYKISMGMTVTLVVVSFIISLMSPDNVSRTGTAVFIPLTILALQLTIASKIPVVGYYTLMDQFFLCCFITSMICSIESGLVYALITTKSPWFFRIVVKFNLVSMKDFEENIKMEELDENIVQEIVEENNSEDGAFENIIKTLETKIDNNELELKRTQSYTEGIRNRKPIKKNIERNIEEGNDFLDNDVYKVINFDDKRLSLTDKERYIDDKLFSFVVNLDNVIRVVLPIVFFSIIIYIFSFEEK
jgi:hypothetical protein